MVCVGYHFRKLMPVNPESVKDTRSKSNQDVVPKEAANVNIDSGGGSPGSDITYEPVIDTATYMADKDKEQDKLTPRGWNTSRDTIRPESRATATPKLTGDIRHLTSPRHLNLTYLYFIEYSNGAQLSTTRSR